MSVPTTSLCWGVILCALLMPTVTDAKATIVTLPELTKESQVIVYGHIDVANDPSLVTGLQFRATQVLKGESSVHEGVIPLCNARPNTEWPDLSKLTGDAVLFLSPRGECFNQTSPCRVR